jgi:hypothetical protein
MGDIPVSISKRTWAKQPHRKNKAKQKNKTSAAATWADGTAPTIAAAANKGIGAMSAGGGIIGQGSLFNCVRG